jgi:hypothetical protein
MQWDAERKAADALLEDAVRRQSSSPGSQIPNAKTHLLNPPEDQLTALIADPRLDVDVLPRSPVPPKPEGESAEREGGSASTEAGELADAIGRIFLSPASTVRSVLFCGVPGDGATDVAWRSAELLASQSGKPIAFVEEPSKRTAPETQHGLITQIEWSDDDVVVESAASRTDGIVVEFAASRTDGIVGEQISDLLPGFAFVVVNAAAAAPEEVATLARQVDGVIVIVLESATSVDAARSLVTSLRNASTALLGAVFVTDRSDHRGPTIFDLTG